MNGQSRWWPTRLERQIAVRYLRGKNVSRLTTLNTRISIAGVTIGVAALTLIMGIMNGLVDDLRDKLLLASPHLYVLEWQTPSRMESWKHQLDLIRKDPDVTRAVPVVLDKGFGVTDDSGASEAFTILGFDPDTSDEAVIPIVKRVVRGDLNFDPIADDSVVDGGILIGIGVEEHLGLQLHDKVFIYTAADLNRRRHQRYEVTGIFETGMPIYDDNFVVMSLAAGRELVRLGEGISAIQVRVKDPMKVDEVAGRLDSLLGNLRVETWKEQNAPLFGALKLEKLGMALIIVLITVVAAFSIIGTLTMVVGDKTREIGILSAMGLTRASIGRVFLTQGAAIGVIGTTAGMILGLGVGYLVDEKQLIKIDPDIYYVSHLPAHFRMIDVLVVIGVSLVISLLATLPASRAASRLQPVDAIRHE